MSNETEELQAPPEGEGATIVDSDLPPLGIAVMASPDGKPVVLMQISTIFGPQVFPLEPSIARRVGLQLQQAGSEATSGLQVAKKSGLIVPGR